MKLDLRAAGETESQLQAEQRGRGEEGGGARASSRREELHARTEETAELACLDGVARRRLEVDQNAARDELVLGCEAERRERSAPIDSLLAAGRCLQHIERLGRKETDRPLQRRRRGGRSGGGSRSGRAGRRSRGRVPSGRSPRTRWRLGCRPGLRARALGSAVVARGEVTSGEELRTRRGVRGRRAGVGGGRTDLEGDELAHDRARAVSPVLGREDEEQEAAPSAGASWFRSHLSLCSCPAV